LPEALRTILGNLTAIGPRRLGLLGTAGALVLLAVAAAAVMLNRPAFETLYVGLERGDVNQIGLALTEAGIRFDVNSDGTAVLVPAGQTAQARMLLAEKGLPTSANAGYELFDQVGSLGLTSFMQEVTRVRALEGEIARTLQGLAGVKAARVHIVMGERESFRRDAQEPSASVVIRTMSGVDARATAQAIRHLVAAAVPGLGLEKVTVLDAGGILLAAGDDPANAGAGRALTVAQTVEAAIEENIRRALSPYLGPENFRASVKAEVNTDTRQTEETIFDPESRVERSVQVVRSNENSSQRDAANTVSVEENLPETEDAPTSGPQSEETAERKEEITNYEINSKRIATVSNGYTLNRMTVAVVINRGRLQAILGEGAGPEALAERVKEIEALVASAAGFTEARGDVITVSPVEFVDGLDGVELAEPGVMDALGSQAGTLINAGAFLLAIALLALFGLRPLAAALRAPAQGVSDGAERMSPAALPQPGQFAAALGSPGAPELGAAGVALPAMEPGATPLDDLRQKIKSAPQERLARMVDLSEERTAQILRKWALEEAA
jgi:flagellar M-ring protein FliF